METKYIFVTGGVTSSLGKGIISASLARLLLARGYRVTIQKFDPYINIDPGTLNPYEHGECYVTMDTKPTLTWVTTSDSPILLRLAPIILQQGVFIKM